MPVGGAELEAALYARAYVLAEEFQAAARLLSDQIIATTNERLRRLEESEVAAARAGADRLYRQRVQGAEIQLRGDLDRKRWRLVQAVMEQLPLALDRVVGDEKAYWNLLSRYLVNAADMIESDHLVAELNARDRSRIAGQWEQFCRQAGVTKKVRLADAEIACSGGIRVSNDDGCIRVDHTFEGRMERLSDLLYQTITEQLFGATLNNEGAAGG
ncbi:MAG: V-type ATP synthase subunit E [Acidiferrobacter sp.]